METFKLVVAVLATLSLGFSLAEIYFSANQLWPRKHDRTVVESLSLTALLVGIIPLTLSAIDFGLHGHWRGMAEALLFVMWGVARAVVALGLWVHEGQQLSFWQRVVRVFRRERDAAADLAMSLFRPSHADQVLAILNEVAWLDNVLHDSEQKMIEEFAEVWRVPFDVQTSRAESHGNSATRLLHLQRLLTTYLETSPPTEQAAHLADVMRRLMAADGDVSEDEQTAMDEMQAMLNAFNGTHAQASTFYAAIVPRDADQADALTTTITGLERRTLPSGEVYVAGPFHSRRFAEKLAEQHRALRLFSVVVSSEVLAEA